MWFDNHNCADNRVTLLESWKLPRGLFANLQYNLLQYAVYKCLGSDTVFYHVARCGRIPVTSRQMKQMRSLESISGVAFGSCSTGAINMLEEVNAALVTMHTGHR